MGLDWNPGNRAKPGFEAEFRDLLIAFRSNLCQRPSPDSEDRYQAISITPYETLKAPRVGYDTAADNWLPTVYNPSQHGNFADFARQMRGFYVVPLVPPCDGLPKYTNGSPGGYVEPFSFRAEWLYECMDVITDALWNDAYKTKLTDELFEYGNSLMEHCRQFAEQQGIELGTPLSNDDLESQEFKADIVYSAAKWCLFWADQGHMLEAYY